MHRGEILAVIGPNGAGKTSLFNSLTGVYTPQEGAIDAVRPAGRHRRSACIGQEDPRHQPPRRRPHVPEHPAVPGADRAGERQGRHRDPAAVRPDRGDAGHALAAPRGAREHRAAPTSCCADVGLAPPGQRARRLAGRTASSGGSRSPGRWAPNPGVLLLDEPAAGTNPVEKRELAELIREINAERGISVLLIEHDMKLVMSIAAPDRRAQLRREDRRGHPGRRSSATRPSSPPTSAPRPRRPQRAEVERQPELLHARSTRPVATTTRRTEDEP